MLDAESVEEFPEIFAPLGEQAAKKAPE